MQNILILRKERLFLFLNSSLEAIKADILRKYFLGVFNIYLPLKLM